MITATTVEGIQQARWREPMLTWGLVPTMGALHEGHLSLVRRAREANARVGVSIFVNPAQFEDPADLEKYPRALERDLRLLGDAEVDLVWMPPVEEVYPEGYQTYVTVEEITQPLEGVHRPGHFRGVTTVVAKLFNVFQPTRAYFGQKDAQQVAVIRQMVRDLNFNLDIVACPTVREKDGLALSSRNRRLKPNQREAALVLFRALAMATDAWAHGDHDADRLRQIMQTAIAAEPLAEADYVSVADPDTLRELSGDVGYGLLSMAVRIGEVRLIDNMLVGAEE